MALLCEIRLFSCHRGPFSTDNNARFGSIEQYLNLIRKTLDFDPGNAGPRQFLADEPPDSEVLVQELSISITLGIPSGVPITYCF
jgi:hypothetical protein